MTDELTEKEAIEFAAYLLTGMIWRYQTDPDAVLIWAVRGYGPGTEIHCTTRQGALRSARQIDALQMKIGGPFSPLSSFPSV